MLFITPVPEHIRHGKFSFVPDPLAVWHESSGRVRRYGRPPTRSSGVRTPERHRLGLALVRRLCRRKFASTFSAPTREKAIIIAAVKTGAATGREGPGRIDVSGGSTSVLRRKSSSTRAIQNIVIPLRSKSEKRDTISFRRFPTERQCLRNPNYRDGSASPNRERLPKTEFGFVSSQPSAPDSNSFSYHISGALSPFECRSQAPRYLSSANPPHSASPSDPD